MWNPFKKKDPLEGQRANYALAFDIVPKVLNAFIVEYLQPIITQYFIDNKSEIWLLFLIAHSKR